MMDVSISDILLKLGPEDILALVRDAELREEGASVHYVIDPAEIFDFCFPIVPGRPAEVNLTDIGNHQLALHDILYRWDSRPLLAGEYVLEAERIIRFFQRHSREVYQREELLEKLLEAAGYREEDFAVVAEQKGYKDAMLERDFRYMLAVRLGFHRLAADRFEEIFGRRMDKTFPAAFPEPLQELVREVGRKHDPLFRALFDAIETSVPLFNAQRIRAARVDAGVIAKLVRINAGCEQLFLEGKIDRRFVFLYASTAGRTRAVFQKLRDVKALPVIKGEGFWFWRSNVQLFAQAVRGRPAPEESNLAGAIARLRNLANFLAEVRRRGFDPTKHRCEGCRLHGGSPQQCNLESLCEELEVLQGAAEESVEAMADMELGSMISTYAELNTTLKGAQKEKYTHFLRAFEEIKRSGSSLREEATLLEQTIRIRSIFAAALPAGARGAYSELAGDEEVDAVTASSQFLPRNPRLTSEALRHVWEAILRAFDKRAAGLMRQEGALGGAFQDVVDAYTEFVELDSRNFRDQEPEHELLRSLLYLSFCKDSSNNEAFDRCLDMVGRFPEIAQEFYYAGIWAGRRAGRFNEADKMALEAIQKYPEDPRLYHGRQLVLYARLRRVPEEVDVGTSLVTCIELTKKALSLYRAEVPVNKTALAANLNNLAFVYSLEFDFGAASDLVAAREALRELRDSVLPKDEWDSHPEYLHTEAHLELQEARAAHALGDVARAESKIRFAYRDANRAWNIFPEKQEHKRTVEEIHAFARQIGVGL